MKGLIPKRIRIKVFGSVLGVLGRLVEGGNESILIHICLPSGSLQSSYHHNINKQ